MKYNNLNLFIQAHGRMPESHKEYAKFCLFGGYVYKN